MVQFNPDGTIKPETPQDVEARYGQVAQMAKSVPELKAILDQATREQWTTDRFIMAVSNTQWYKQNGSGVREWVALETTDPQTARDKLGHGKGDIQAIANEMGIPMSDAQLEQAFFFRQFSGGMSDQNFRNYLARTYFDAYNFDWVNGSGQAAEYASQLDTLRQNYGMPDGEEYSWVRDNLNKVMRGEQTMEGMAIAARAYASSKYTAFTEQIERGMTVYDLAQPYMDSYRNILEQDVNKGLSDQLIQKAMQFNDGGRALPVWEFEKQLRQDERWSKTHNAQSAMSQVLTKIGQDFGYVARGA